MTTGAEQQSGETDFSAEIMDVFGIPDAGGEGAPPSPAAGEPQAGGVPASPPASGAGEAGAAEPPSGAAPAPSPAPASTPPAEPAQTPPGTPAQPAAGAPPQPQSPTAPSAPVPAPAPAAAPVENREALLEAQNVALRAQLAALQPQPQTPQTGAVPPPVGGAPAPGQPQPAPTTEDPTMSQEFGGSLPYGEVVLPQDVYTAIMSEDNAQSYAAMNHLVKNILGVVHTNIRREMAAYVPRRFEALTAATMAQQQQQERAREMETDYFGAFPTHNNPTVRMILAQENAKLAAEFPGVPWNETYRNALGARVTTALTSLGVQPSAAAPATIVPAASAAPATPLPAAPAPVFMGSAPRPADTGQQSDGDFILETMKAG